MNTKKTAPVMRIKLLLGLALGSFLRGGTVELWRAFGLVRALQNHM